MKQKSVALLTLTAATLGAAALVPANPACADALADMISPVTHPTTFEDPRSISDIRPVYVYHKLHDQFITNGGNVSIMALQIRYAIDDRLSIIATKDGFINLNPDSVVGENEGWANVAFGAKYAFFKDETSIATAGLRYEAPVGEKEVLQGYGNGLANPFFSYGANFGAVNIMAGTGLRVGLDSNDSTLWDLDIHADYKICSFYPLIEFGLNHVLDAGDRLPIADEGQDFFNLGSSESSGETLVTGAVGARYRIADNVDAGMAYQIPLNSGSGTRIIDWRLTSDLVVRF